MWTLTNVKQALAVRKIAIVPTLKEVTNVDADKDMKPLKPKMEDNFVMISMNAE